VHTLGPATRGVTQEHFAHGEYDHEDISCLRFLQHLISGGGGASGAAGMMAPTTMIQSRSTSHDAFSMLQGCITRLSSSDGVSFPWSVTRCMAKHNG